MFLYDFHKLTMVWQRRKEYPSWWVAPPINKPLLTCGSFVDLTNIEINWGGHYLGVVPNFGDFWVDILLTFWGEGFIQGSHYIDNYRLHYVVCCLPFLFKFPLSTFLGCQDTNRLGRCTCCCLARVANSHQRDCGLIPDFRLLGRGKCLNHIPFIATLFLSGNNKVKWTHLSQTFPGGLRKMLFGVEFGFTTVCRRVSIQADTQSWSINRLKMSNAKPSWFHGIDSSVL